MARNSHRHTDCRTRELLLSLTPDDLRRLLDALPSRHLHHVHVAVGLPGPSGGRAARRTATNRLRPLLARLDHDGAVEIAAVLTSPVLEHLEDLAGDLAEPTDETLAIALGRWGAHPLVLAFQIMWETGDIDMSELDKRCRAINEVASHSPEQVSSRPSSPQPSPSGLMRVLREVVIGSRAGPDTGVQVADLTVAIDYLAWRDPRPTWDYLRSLFHGELPSDPVPGEPDTDTDLVRLVAGLENVGLHELSVLHTTIAALPFSTVIRMSGRPEAAWLVPHFLVGARDDAARLRELVSVVPEPFDGWASFVESIAREDPDTLPEATAEKEALLVELEHALDRWADTGRPDAPRSRSLLTLARVRCRRVRGDFAAARRLLAQVDESLLDDSGQCLLAMERAMAVAGIRSAELVQFPRSEADMVRAAQRLAPVRRDLLRALDLDPTNALGHVLLGLLLHCEEDPAAAAHLRTALWLIEQNGTTSSEPLLAELRFVAGLAQLRLLEPGTDDEAYASMSSSLESGYVPSSGNVVTAVQAFEAHDSSHLGAFLGCVRQLIPHEPELLTVVTERAGRGDAECMDLAEALAADSRVRIARRASLLTAALIGSEVANDVARAERVIYALDDVLIRGVDRDLDEEFADVLATLDVVKLAFGPAAEGLRIEVLRRIGRIEEASTLTRQLFFRAASRSLPPEFDTEELLLLLAELGETDDELDKLRALVTRSDIEDKEIGVPLTGDLRVVFVGGHEAQRRYVPAVEDAIRSRFGDQVVVDWFLTGWRSTWSRDLEEILAAMKRADAVVVMTFVRTHLGQHVRRHAGEHGLQWVSCTGHGRASLTRAIERAVELVIASRQQSPDGGGPPG